MIRIATSLLAVVVSTGTAFAGPQPNLAVDLTGPTTRIVEQPGGYNVNVANIGNKNASGVSLVITLPDTNSSPQNYVLGVLTGVDPRCSLSSATLTCALGTINKNASTNVAFTIAVPWTSESVVFAATATTTTLPETNATNNSDSLALTQTYIATPIVTATSVFVENRHCTGTGLTSFYVCTLFSGAISQHDVDFNFDGTITFVNPSAPDMSGAWSQNPSGSSLFFEYYDDLGAVVATFNGNGVGSDCFEGLTTFPDSSYVAPYEVCLQ